MLIIADVSLRASSFFIAPLDAKPATARFPKPQSSLSLRDGWQ